MKDNSFYLYLTISIATHFVVTLLFIFTNLNWGGPSKKTTFQSSIRVDMVALPDFKKYKEKIKKTAPKDISVSLQKKKSVKKKKKKIKPKKKLNTEKKISNTSQNKDDKRKGNQLSKGVDGGLSEKEQLEAVNIYLTLIIGKIKLNWNLPKHLSDQSYFTQLEVKINNNGQVIYKQIVTSSNNDVFDGRVLKAIESSEPFPPPPDNVKKLISDGIVFGLSSKD